MVYNFEDYKRPDLDEEDTARAERMIAVAAGRGLHTFVGDLNEFEQQGFYSVVMPLNEHIALVNEYATRGVRLPYGLMAQHVSYAEASNRVDAIVHSSELLFESAKMAIQAAGLPSVA